jgi:hypothetical protein
MGKFIRDESSSRTYVVFVGRRTGVFSTLDECNEQVHGFSGNLCRRYLTRASAEQAWRESTAYLEGKNSYPEPIKKSKYFLNLSPTNKRPFHNVVDLTGSEDEEKPAEKICRTDSDRHLDGIVQSENITTPPQTSVDACIVLTPDQQSVVDLANSGHNIFLTGAAGCGKTVTLKEIIRCLKGKPRRIRVSVIAPTGIAALPLKGMTTYSFAGWTTESFKRPMSTLLEKVTEKAKEE